MHTRTCLNNGPQPINNGISAYFRTRGYLGSRQVAGLLSLDRSLNVSRIAGGDKAKAPPYRIGAWRHQQSVCTRLPAAPGREGTAIYLYRLMTGSLLLFFLFPFS
jgi:hypothetical protein